MTNQQLLEAVRAAKIKAIRSAEISKMGDREVVIIKSKWYADDSEVTMIAEAPEYLLLTIPVEKRETPPSHDLSTAFLVTHTMTSFGTLGWNPNSGHLLLQGVLPLHPTDTAFNNKSIAWAMKHNLKTYYISHVYHLWMTQVQQAKKSGLITEQQAGEWVATRMATINALLEESQDSGSWGTV